MSTQDIVKQTLLKALAPIMIFLIGQAGYLISWMSRVETTLVFVQDELHETQTHIKQATVDRYTSQDAARDLVAETAKFERIVAAIKELQDVIKTLDVRIRALETRK